MNLTLKNLDTGFGSHCAVKGLLKSKQVKVSGEQIHYQSHVYFILYKPVGLSSVSNRYLTSFLYNLEKYQ